MDDVYHLAAQTITDAFSTPLGRSMIDRFHERSSFVDDSNQYRTPAPPLPLFNQPAFEAQTWWQTTIWAIIVASILLGMVLL